MKKFARCVLILILVAVLSGVGGYIYENNTITPMYESVSKLYIVPGSQNEASIRAKNGGLNQDFTIIFSSKVVIESAQRLAGTSEDISEYLTVSSPADSNIVELKVTNPDQNTAKTYVDAIAKTAVKTTTIIPVESIQILSEGTSDGVATKPHLYYYTGLIVAAASAVCVFIELVVCLILCAFKKKEDHSDDEYEYEARFGRYAYPGAGYIEAKADSTKRIPYDNSTQGGHRKIKTDDILAEFDDEDDDEEYDDSFLYKSSGKGEDNKHDTDTVMEAAVAQEEDIPEVHEPENTEQEVTESEESESEPVVAEPEMNESEPVVAEPEMNESEPEAAEPEESESEPVVAEPEMNESEPEVTELEAAEPEEPEAETDVAEPETAEPTLVDEEPAPIEVEEPVVKQDESGVRILGRIYK